MEQTLTYWQKRFLQVKQAQLDKAATYEKEYNQRLKQTQKEIEQEINKWCAKYAKEDGTIDPLEAKKQLRGADLQNFKYSRDEWERMAKAGGYDHEMNLEYYKSRVSRLQALQAQVTSIMGKQTSGDVNKLSDTLKDTYSDTYYRSIYNVQQAKWKVSANFAHVDENKLDSIIRSGWSGANFSQRLWGNATKLLPQALSESLFRGISLGYGNDKLVKMARVKLQDFSENQIHRLVITETAHITEQAGLNSYKESGVEKVEWLATLESHTCDQCRALDGKVFELKKAEKPPVHPYCRCTLAPWYKELEEISTTRWSRDPETGKGKFVKDMSYEQWQERVGLVSNKQNSSNNSKMDLESIKQFMNSIDMKQASHEELTMLGSLVNGAFDVAGNIGNKDKLKEIFSNFREIGGQVPKDGWAKGSSKETKTRINDTFAFYPKEWAEYAHQNGKTIFTKKLDRGFFSEAGLKGRSWKSGVVDNGVSIMLSDNATASFHEIGHYVEYFNPNAMRLSKEFLAYRTKGEEEQPIRNTIYYYNVRERTKKDNFITPYIGKTYSNATEVFSTGLECLFEPGNGKVFSHESRISEVVKKKISDDPEYLNFIIGMILKG
ncbi:hypothetical protein EFL90_11570 [Lactococcus lactis]|nr:hypothetical protein [Lactococcus lactis]